MHIVKRDQLPWSEIAHELVCAEHGLDITVLFVDAPSGRGPALHRHPYAALFIVQEGEARFTVDGQQQEARAGDIVIARANQPHSFVNSGTRPIRQIDIRDRARAPALGDHLDRKHTSADLLGEVIGAVFERQAAGGGQPPQAPSALCPAPQASTPAGVNERNRHATPSRVDPSTNVV